MDRLKEWRMWILWWFWLQHQPTWLRFWKGNLILCGFGFAILIVVHCRAPWLQNRAGKATCLCRNPSIVYLMLPHMVLFPFPFILIKGPCFDIFNTLSVAPSPLLSFLLVLSHCAYYYHTIISHIISYSFDKRLTHRVGVPRWVMSAFIHALMPTCTLAALMLEHMHVHKYTLQRAQVSVQPSLLASIALLTLLVPLESVPLAFVA